MADIENKTIENEKPGKKKARPAFNLNERVAVTIPRGSGDQYVAVGKGFMLPEGKTSYVPRYIEQEVRRSEHAKDLLTAEMEKRQQPMPRNI